MVLVEEVYKIVKQLPKEEYYILGSQILRAVISIPSNIAEGYLRRHQKEYSHFLSISLGSAGELQTQLMIICKQYPKIDCTKANSLVEEVLKMLFVMVEKIGHSR